MRVQVYQHRGSPLSVSAGVLRLEEARRYFVALPEEASDSGEVYLGPLRLAWDASEGAFELHITHWAGAQLLRVVTDGAAWTVPIEVVPREEKLSEEAWVAMLDELEAWLPSSSVGALPGLHGSVVAGGPRSALLVEALLPLVRPLLAAIGAVLASPRLRDDCVEAFISAHQVRRVHPSTLRHLERHPEAWSALSASWEPREAAARPPVVPTRQGTTELDHAANAYVSWLVVVIGRDLTALAGLLDGEGARGDASGPDGDWGGWCQARSAQLLAAARSLGEVRRQSWLSEVPPRPPSDAALAVVADDPLYGRVHRLARRFRSTLFRPEARHDGLAATTRPSYELYELWTLLRLRRLLGELLPEHAWTATGLAPLVRLGEPLDGAGFRAEGPTGTLQLLFNPTFRGYLSRGSTSRYSISGERRPDLVLTWESAGRRAWWALDAKYRVRKEMVADALSSAHVYRDSLRWDEYGGRCEAAVLLVPAVLPECGPWFEPGFLAENGVGVFEVRPGVAVGGRIEAWVGAELTEGPRAVGRGA